MIGSLVPYAAPWEGWATGADPRLGVQQPRCRAALPVIRSRFVPYQAKSDIPPSDPCRWVWVQMMVPFWRRAGARASLEPDARWRSFRLPNSTAVLFDRPKTALVSSSGERELSGKSVGHGYSRPGRNRSRITSRASLTMP